MGWLRRTGLLLQLSLGSGDLPVLLSSEATALCRETASTGYGVSNKCFEIPWPEPPVHRIKLTEAREITPYVWDHTSMSGRRLTHGQFTASALLGLRVSRNRA